MTDQIERSEYCLRLHFAITPCNTPSQHDPTVNLYCAIRVLCWGNSLLKMTTFGALGENFGGLAKSRTFEIKFPPLGTLL